MKLIVNPQSGFLTLKHGYGAELYIDFNSKSLNFKRKNSINKRSLIARAVGLKSKNNLNIVDLTAGLGKDAFFLACLGCKVLLIEHNDTVAKLLQDGLTRAGAIAELQPIINNMHLEIGDARDILRDYPKDTLPEVIYLDPMFPERNKSALVKKEMRVLQELVGFEDINSNASAAELLQIALTKCSDRVVVKRPRHAAAIDATVPSIVMEGKSCRYDIYLCNN